MPPKPKKMSKKIIIIGQGIIGACTAYTLARAAPDYEIVSIAAHPIASGATASGASWGWVNAHTDNDEEYFNFRNASRLMWHDLIDELPKLAAQISPSLVFDLSDDAMKTAQAHHADWGYPIALVERAQILEHLSLFRGAPDLALFTQGEVAVETDLAAHHLLERSGATKVIAQVHALIPHGSQIKAVMTDQGPIAADHVILAAGHGSPDILRSVGVEYALDQSFGLIVRTQPVQKFLTTMIMGMDYHVRQCRDGSLLIGGAFDQHQTSGIDYERAAQSLCAAVETAFDLDAVGMEKLVIDRFTIGKRVLPYGGRPQIGRVGHYENLISLAMHGGVTNAPIAAKTASDLVLGQPRCAYSTPFNFTRIRP